MFPLPCVFTQVAELLFFVIDNNTRSVASLCEIAYLVGKFNLALTLALFYFKSMHFEHFALNKFLSHYINLT